MARTYALSVVLALTWAWTSVACTSSNPPGDARSDANTLDAVGTMDAITPQNDVVSRDIAMRDSFLPDARDVLVGRDVIDAAVRDASMQDAAPDATCLGTPFVFTRPAPFVPTVAVPILRIDIPISPAVTYGRIDVDLDFVRGPWASPAPSTGGIHNIFWLHRGVRGTDWLDNLVMYMNITGLRNMRLSSNLGITDRTIWSQNIDRTFTSTEGQAYHAEAVYDAVGRRRWLRVTQGATVLAYGQDVPVVTSIPSRSPYPRGQSAFFVEIGFGAWDGSGGPEVPTYGWEYLNLVIRFHPIAACP